jgi:hypothetical protein
VLRLFVLKSSESFPYSFVQGGVAWERKKRKRRSAAKNSKKIMVNDVLSALRPDCSQATL